MADPVDSGPDRRSVPDIRSSGGLSRWNHLTQPTVALIGAGMSGLCMAATLQDSGHDAFTIFEKADDVGGTRRDNTYPGLTCDIPSRYYSYSFRPNPNRSRFRPPGPEIQSYFRQVADERGLRRHIRFGTDVTAARFEDGRWVLTTVDGEEGFDVLVTAAGVLRIPRSRDSGTLRGRSSTPRGGITRSLCGTSGSV